MVRLKVLLVLDNKFSGVARAIEIWERPISKVLKMSKMLANCLIIKRLKIMEKSLFIGIDVSKNELDFAVVESNKTLFHIEVTNDKQGIDSFMKQLKTDVTHTVLIDYYFVLVFEDLSKQF